MNKIGSNGQNKAKALKLNQESGNRASWVSSTDEIAGSKGKKYRKKANLTKTKAKQM